jgi:hypothetical protein
MVSRQPCARARTFSHRSRTVGEALAGGDNGSIGEVGAWARGDRPRRDRAMIRRPGMARVRLNATSTIVRPEPISRMGLSVSSWALA